MRLAFRIVAGVFGVFVLGTSVPFAIGSFVDESQDLHLIHNLSGAAVYGVLLGVGLISLRDIRSNLSRMFENVNSGLSHTN